MKKVEWPPIQDSLLSQAIHTYQQLDEFCHQNANRVEYTVIAPWELEQHYSARAIQMEWIEKKGQEPAKSSVEYWREYELKYRELDEQIYQGKIVLNLILESGQLNLIERLVGRIENDLRIQLELVEDRIFNNEHIVTQNPISHSYWYQVSVQK